MTRDDDDEVDDDDYNSNNNINNVSAGIPAIVRLVLLPDHFCGPKSFLPALKMTTREPDYCV